MRSLHVVLATAPDPEPIASSEAWWQRHRAVALIEPAPLDQAIRGGFSADRLGYAFASGYQAALRVLWPDLPAESVASLCVTERGGGQPRAIETRLEPAGPGAYRVTGKKRWATLAGDAGTLLVAASMGVDEVGKNRVRVVRIPSTAPGVVRRPMAEPPFLPEIGHDEIELSSVRVEESDILPGDGFARYVRPFRTVEDIHVTAAIYAYLIREIRLHGLPRTLSERFAALLVALDALNRGDPAAPEVHLALAGVLGLARTLIDELDRIWGRTESPAHARWERDRLLLSVAGAVRERRTERAWERLARKENAGEDSTGSAGIEAPPWARSAT